jgi:hypothetical protein
VPDIPPQSRPPAPRASSRRASVCDRPCCSSGKRAVGLRRGSKSFPRTSKSRGSTREAETKIPNDGPMVVWAQVTSQCNAKADFTLPIDVLVTILKVPVQIYEQHSSETQQINPDKHFSFIFHQQFQTTIREDGRAVKALCLGPPSPESRSGKPRGESIRLATSR